MLRSGEEPLAYSRAMSGKQRLGLVAAAIVVGVIAFLIASPGTDEDEDSTARQQTVIQTETTTDAEPAPTATTKAPPEARFTRLASRAGAVQGGPWTSRVKSGETVRIAVTSDAADEIHVHGYDLTRRATPAKPARFRFRASIEGEFEIESHTAEHAGKDPLVARLVVEPS